MHSSSSQPLAVVSIILLMAMRSIRKGSTPFTWWFQPPAPELGHPHLPVSQSRQQRPDRSTAGRGLPSLQV